ncbi:AraC family transcriptional regulator [uncultured Desulfobacter sp.]|uniref:helix-turn-helix transcriptional regulator n=1 Tax=uncultured Desulfobacter sp. TaxID=240139 RepID=UPI0029F4617D|nr:AraC family transcriptional regulator [uncultured Desulfobacter sp.]
MEHDFMHMGEWQEGIDGSSVFSSTVLHNGPINWVMSDVFGQASIQMIKFRSGMTLSFQRRRFKHETKLYGQSDEAFIGFHFCLSGFDRTKVNGVGNDLQFCRDNNGFIIAKNGWQWRVEVPEKQNFSIVAIGFTFNDFRKIVCDQTQSLPSVLQCVCEDKVPEFASLSMPSTPQIRLVLAQMLDPSLTLSHRKLYFEAKSLELIDLMIDLLNHTNHDRHSARQFQSSEIDRLYHVREVIQKDLANPPNLYDLAKIAGMNHCKLNRGFKALFGNTVFGCLRDMRLETARRLLTAGKMNVTEASCFVGYSCLSHFSSAFKEQYKMNPRECLKCSTHSDLFQQAKLNRSNR